MGMTRVNEPVESFAERPASPPMTAGPQGAPPEGQLDSRGALELQGRIGNRALARVIAARRALQRVDADIDVDAQTVDVQTVSDTPSDPGSNTVSFDPSGGTAWPKLNGFDVRNGLADRVADPSKVYQGDLGLCGPAAITNWMAEQEPQKYEDMVSTVYRLGGIHGRTCNDTLLNSESDPELRAVDWMFLSTMQDLANDVFPFYGRPGNSLSDNHYWAAGTATNDAASIMTSFTDISKTNYLGCSYYGEQEQTAKVSKLLATYGNRVCVLMAVDHTTFQNEYTSNRTDHWIRLLAPVNWDDPNVYFESFSWGRYYRKWFKARNFKTMIDGYLIGTVDDSINIDP